MDATGFSTRFFSFFFFSFFFFKNADYPFFFFFSEHTWPWTQLGSLRCTRWLQARLKMYSNYPANRRAGRKPAGQLITGRRCCGQGCPLPPGGRRLFAKHWPLGLSRAFEALSLPQKSEGDALQPSRGSEVFKEWCPGLPGGCGWRWGCERGRGKVCSCLLWAIHKTAIQERFTEEGCPMPGSQYSFCPGVCKLGTACGCFEGCRGSAC